MVICCENYKRAGVPVLGIEPAINIARVAEEEHGIPTICDFFGEQLAQQLRAEGYRADVIHANNVLAHVPDLNGFVRGLRTLLKDDGVAVIEVPYVKEMIDALRVRHDLSRTSQLLFTDRTRQTLPPSFAEYLSSRTLPIHGGTLRIYISTQGAIRMKLFLMKKRIGPAIWGFMQTSATR